MALWLYVKKMHRELIYVFLSKKVAHCQNSLQKLGLICDRKLGQESQPSSTL